MGGAAGEGLDPTLREISGPSRLLGRPAMPRLRTVTAAWLLLVAALPMTGAAAWALLAAADATAWRALAQHPLTPWALGYSLWTGLASTTLAWLGCALLLSQGFVRRSLARTLRLLPVMLATPHAAFAIGLAFLLSPSGWALRIVSPWLTQWAVPPPWPTVQDPWGLGLIAALTVKELPFLLWAAGTQLLRGDVHHRLAAAGGSGVRADGGRHGHRDRTRQPAAPGSTGMAMAARCGPGGQCTGRCRRRVAGVDCHPLRRVGRAAAQEGGPAVVDRVA